MWIFDYTKYRADIEPAVQSILIIRHIRTKTRNRIFNQFPKIYTKQNIKKRQIQGSSDIERKLRLDIALDVVPKFCKVITSFLFCTSIVWYNQYFLFLYFTFTSIENCLLLFIVKKVFKSLDNTQLDLW